MFANAILDVAIGLVFLYTLLSLVTTSVTEGCANLLSARSRALERWLVNMLDDTREGDGRRGREIVDEMLAHPLIRGLRPHQTRVRALAPDHIPAPTFCAVLLETLGPPSSPGSKIPRRPRSIAELEQRIVALDERSPLRRLLLNLITPATDLREAEQIIEAWFDSSMERLRGWYARRSQLAAFGFAAALTWMLNADTLMLANALWQDAELRTAVAVRAEAAASSGDDGSPPTIGQLADELAELRGISGFPLGWDGSKNADLRAVPSSAVGWAEKLLGFALTILATTLGAPFWFGLLSRVLNLRRGTKTKDERGEASVPARGRITTLVATRDGVAATDIDAAPSEVQP